MTEDTVPIAAGREASAVTSPTGREPQLESHKLQGRIGTVELVMTVLAFSAPILVVASFSPFVIIYNGPTAPLAYVIAMIVLLFFSVGYTAMSRHLPNAGAFYAYITAGIGRPFGLGASFLAVLGYILMAVGTVGFVGVAANSLVVNVFSGPDIPWQVFSFGLLTVTGILGYFRIDLSAKVLLVAMVAEVGIVLIFDMFVLGDGGPEGRSMAPFNLGDFSSGGGVGLAVLFAATSFLGFEATAIFREETKDPDRTVPRATYAAVFFIGLFYVLGVYCLITAYGPSAVQGVASENFVNMFNVAIEANVGSWARDVVQVLIVTSGFACLLSVQNIMSRYVFSLGVDEVLPKALGRPNPKHGSPSIASVAVSGVLVAVLLSQAGKDPELVYAKLAGAGGFAILVLMFLAGISVVAFFQRNPDAHASTWHRLVAPIISAITMGIILYLAATNFTHMTGGSMTEAVVLQIILWGTFVVGIVLALIYRQTKPAVFERIGRQKV